MKSVRFLFVIVVWLASISGAVGAMAHRLPDSPLVGGCIPGAAYDAACDANHDGAIDVTDLQLTAGHWEAF